MPSSHELAQSTDFLGTLENAIRADDEARNHEAFKATVRSQTDADRAMSRLSEQGLELGGILALLLSKGRLSGAPVAANSRGWNLSALLGGKKTDEGDACALYVTPQGVLLARGKSKKTPAATVGLVGVVALLGLLASGVAPVTFGACVLTILLGAGTGASLYAAGQLANELEDIWLIAGALALAIALGVGAHDGYRLIHVAHAIRPLLSAAATLVSGVAIGVKAPARLRKFFGWKTATAGVDFNAETIAGLTRLVQPQIEKLGYTMLQMRAGESEG